MQQQADPLAVPGSVGTCHAMWASRRLSKTAAEEQLTAAIASCSYPTTIAGIAFAWGITLDQHLANRPPTTLYC